MFSDAAEDQFQKSATIKLEFAEKDIEKLQHTYETLRIQDSHILVDTTIATYLTPSNGEQLVNFQRR
jgi:hypothetical protein